MAQTMGTSTNCSICGYGDVKEILTLKSGKKILKCKRCKNAFTHPKPLIPDYSSEDFQSRDGARDKLTFFKDLPEEIKKSYSIQMEMVEKNLPKGSRILEIGGGEGIFLDMLKSKGYEVELIEPSVSASQRAKIRGLNVHTDYFQRKTFDKKYALICMSHVLEHIEYPLDTLKSMKSLLTPGGFVLLAQTNFKGFMPLFLKANWYAWVPEQHFSHFSLEGIEHLAAKSSFSVFGYKYSRLVHSPSIYHRLLNYIPILQDQIHVLLKLNNN